jgi:hypothetical protein
MAVESTMVPLGTLMPEFVLTDLSGHQVQSTDLAGTPALVMFLCNHCPYVRHAETRLGEMLHEFADLPAVGICSNDAVAYPDDAPERHALAHEPVPEPHRPSMGCSIKWRA